MRVKVYIKLRNDYEINHAEYLINKGFRIKSLDKDTSGVLLEKKQEVINESY